MSENSRDMPYRPIPDDVWDRYAYAPAGLACRRCAAMIHPLGAATHDEWHATLDGLTCGDLRSVT